MRCEAQHLCKALDTLQDLPTIEDPPPPLCTNEAKDTLEDPLNYFLKIFLLLFQMAGTTQPGFQDAFKQYQDECQNECDIIKFMIMWY